MKSDPDSEETERQSTIEFFLELAKASEDWVARIRTTYLWVSFILMLFLSLLVGLYVPYFLNMWLTALWIQLALAVAIMLPVAAIWYHFLRKFDHETRLWQDRIRRLREQEAVVAKLLEDKEE
jgi:membrane protein implicated in regulation of membrane protease activity